MRRILSSALDWVRPYHVSIGFRVRKLSRSQVEAVIPDRTHNRNGMGEIEEGVAISVAQQMTKLLVARWEVPVELELDQINFARLQPLKGDLIARVEWEDLSREALRADLIRNITTTQEFFVHISDAQEMRVADIQVTLKIRLPQTLGTNAQKKKGTHGDHS